MILNLISLINTLKSNIFLDLDRNRVYGLFTIQSIFLESLQKVHNVKTIKKIHFLFQVFSYNQYTQYKNINLQLRHDLLKLLTIQESPQNIVPLLHFYTL